MIPQTLIANQMGRLFFRCFTAAGSPFKTLIPSQIASGNVQRRQIQAAGGNWLSADHLGQPWETLNVGVDTDPLNPGTFIQQMDETGKRNLYSIDVAHTHVTTLWDTDAIRLNLSSNVSIVFYPYTHLVVPEVVI